MTMIYLANCLAITFVPPWMIYKYKLQEFADTRQVVQAGFWYATIQLLQLILTATFVPSADPRSFDIVQELMKAFITLCDCFGLYRMFAPRRMAQGSAAVIGLSWAGAESVLHRLVPLIVEAQGLQFSWRHALSSVEANISLRNYMALSVLIWLWVRKPQQRSGIVAIIALQRFVVPLITSYLSHAVFQETPMIAVAAHGFMVAVFASVVFKMCSRASTAN